MIGEKYIKRLLSKATAPSSLRSYTSVFNDMPVMPFDRLSQAVFMAYCKSDVLYSIINKKATTAGRAPYSVYRIKSLSAQKEYKAYMQQKDIRLDKVLELKESAVEPINHQLNERFANPNDSQSESEFTEDLVRFLNITGNAYQYDQFDSKRIMSMESMPADIMEIIADGNWNPKVSSYRLMLGDIHPFTKEEIVHFRYGNPRWTSDGRHLYGMSPIEVLWNLIQADEEGNDAVAEQRKNRGPRILVGVENSMITELDAGLAAMDGFKEKFDERTLDFKDRMMPLLGKITVEDVGLKPDALNLKDSSQAFFQKACNVFNVPYQWFSTSNESKYSNLEIYNKQAIINGVIPDHNKVRDARNRHYRQRGIIGPNEFIDFDISVYSELNIDRAQMWGYLKDMTMKENDKLKEMGLSPYDDIPEMDQVFINRNKIPIQNINDINNGQNINQEGAGRDSQEEDPAN